MLWVFFLFKQKTAYEMRISDWSSDVCSSDLLVGLNLQGRHNPKRKGSLRYGDSPENNPDYAVDDFDNREDQRDTRDGKDYSANATYEIDGETTDFRISGLYEIGRASCRERVCQYV